MSSGENTSYKEDDAAIRRQAADWIVKSDLGFTSEDEETFSNWLSEDPRHNEAYERRLLIWEQFDQLKERSSETAESSDEGVSSIPMPKNRWLRPGALTALAASLVLGLFVWQSWNPLEKEGSLLLSQYEVAPYYERHALEDGSVVELNEGAQASVDYTAKERLITLLSGEAHFTVAKDASRPFVVVAGETRIKALGTAFNVQLGAKSVEVVVTEGRVWLDPLADDQGLAPDETAPSSPYELSAGQRSYISASVSSAPQQIETVSEEEMAERLNWKSPTIEFIDSPLSEVVSELNRYNDIQIVIANAETAKHSITATISPKNLDRFRELVEGALDIQVDTSSPNEMVLREREE